MFASLERQSSDHSSANDTDKRDVLNEIGSKWNKFSKQERSALKTTDELVDQNHLQVRRDKIAAQRDVDTLMNGRDLHPRPLPKVLCCSQRAGSLHLCIRPSGPVCTAASSANPCFLHAVDVLHPHAGRSHNDNPPAHVVPYAGHDVLVGDASPSELLQRIGLDSALAVVVTTESPEATADVVAAVRSSHADVTIVARARDAHQARRLYELGATDAVPETDEASLQLCEALLVEIGVRWLRS